MTTDIIIAIAGVVFGFITSYFFYRIQRKRRELCWSIDDNNLIKGYSSLFEKLDIQYGGEKIENLTVSKVALWNNGNETIDGKDIAIPPFILPRDKTTKILDAQIVKTSTIGNRIRIHQKQDDPMLVLLFDYLDPQQGAVLQVIHTGVSVLPLMVDGEVKGVKEIEYKSKRLDFVSQAQRLYTYLNVLWIVVFLGFYAYNSVFRGIPATSDWTVWILIFLIPIATFFVIYDIRQMKGTAKIPKELSVFEKDDIGIKRKS